MADFTPPQSVEEGEQRRLDLVRRVQEVQTDLGNKNRTVNGQRMTDREYWDWRNRAAYALKCLQDELRELNHWLKQHRQRVRNQPGPVGAPIVSDDPISLLESARRALKSLARDLDGDITDEEQDVIDAIDDFLVQHKSRERIAG